MGCDIDISYAKFLDIIIAVVLNWWDAGKNNYTVNANNEMHDIVNHAK